MKKEDFNKLRELIENLRQDALMGHMVWLSPDEEPRRIDNCQAWCGKPCNCIAEGHNFDVEVSVGKLLAELDRLEKGS